MRMSFDEIICFNSLLDGKKIVGLNEKVDQTKKDDYVLHAKEQLHIHAFLDETGKPNKEFFLAVTVLKEYKQAEYYLLINNARIAFSNKKGYVICLAKKEDGYEFEVTHKEVMYIELIKRNTFLSTPPESKVCEMIKMSRQEFVKKNESECFENVLWIQMLSKTSMTYPRILYNQGEQGFLYDMKEEVLNRCTGLELCKELANYFKIKVDRGK